MRETLEKYYKKRIRVRATVDRFGMRSSYKGPNKTTILLKDITKTDTKEYLTDHIWFTTGKRFDKCKLISGDIIEFDARIDMYSKGYGEYSEIDYKLAYPTKIEVIQRKVHTYQELYDFNKEEIEQSYQKYLENKQKRILEKEEIKPKIMEIPKKKEKEQSFLTDFL